MNAEWVRRHRKESAAAASVVLAGIVTLAIVLNATSGPIEPTPMPSQVGQSSAGPSAEPSFGGEVGWGSLQLPPYEPVADLVPRQQDRSGIGPRAGFELRSLSGTPAVELARGLRISPPVKLAISAGPTRDVAIVRPATPLVASTRYSFELLAPDGSLVGEWDFRTGGPLQVVNVLPGDQTTQVPLDTGIEIEFDQDGVENPADHVTIEPATAGRFERHGRTWAFVPARNLQASTLYTVTVRRGLGLAGSDQVLESPVVFRFETSGRNPSRQATVTFNAPLFEGLPGEAPVLPVSIYDPDGDRRQVRVRVEIYRFSTIRQAVNAVATLSNDLGWARISSAGSVPLDGLSKVAAVDATAAGDWRGASMPLPVELRAGRYLVNVVRDGRDAQVVLQISDISVYAMASETRTIAWVNDLRTDRPIAGAEVSVVGASSLGTTGANGLLDVPTPASVRGRYEDGGRTFLIVTADESRQLIAPLGADGGWRGPRERSWFVFATDRTTYRTDDTIHSWGFVRNRGNGSVPGAAEVRLVAGYDETGPALARARATVTTRGTFTSAMDVRDLPHGNYLVIVSAEGRDVAQATVRVAEIRKPAFRIEVETTRRAYLHGQVVEGRAVAAFYDGTTAPGLRLRMSGYDGDRDREEVVTADASGSAALSFRASASDGWLSSGYLGATPEQTEEGTSSGYADFAILPSSAWLTGDATLAGGRLDIGGRVTEVDLAAADLQVATSGWVEDPSGAPLAGRTVRIEVNRITWLARQVGTTYDFILKRTVPRYEYRERTDRIGSFSITTGRNGTYELVVPDMASSGSYQVRLSVADAQGRVMRTEVWASESGFDGSPRSQPYLELPGYGCGPFSGAVREAHLSEEVTLTLREGDGSTSPAGRTLYLTGRVGIQDARVTSDSSLTHVFGDAALPSLTVRAVRITSGGLFVTNDVLVRLQNGEKGVNVELVPDRPAYAPGSEATVSIRTTGTDGGPRAADVVVRVIDMKLYAVGAAEPLGTEELMATVSSGFLASYGSHRVPRSFDGDGCGATSGGGEDLPREDFKDLASFQLVQTDAAGRGRVSFTMPDDITSWEVGAAAFTDSLESGTAAIELPASLPFFVDSVVAPSYLAGERPILQLRAYGDGLKTGDTVRFAVTSRSLGIDNATVEGRAFETVSYELPALPLGDHRLTVSGRVPGSAVLRDEVVRRVRVVPTRLHALTGFFDRLTDGLVLQGGEGMTTYVVTDAGRGGLLEALRALASGASARLDAAFAAELARGLLVDEFGMDPDTLPASEFNRDRLFGDGLALLPYAQADLFLTARVALVAGAEMPQESWASALRTWADEPAATRERRIVALAGLAGIGHDVLAELRTIEQDGLTVDEQLWLALGLAAAGDEPAARSIERAILKERGQRLGDWVRISGGTPADAYEATALVLLLAAELRDPVSLDLARYLLENPSRERIAAMEMVGFARAGLRWLPRETARFAWTLDGVRSEEQLENGGSFQLVVTAAQRRSLRIEPIEGAMMVAGSWDGEADYASLPQHPLVQIQRNVTPAGTATVGQLVRVTINVTIDREAPRGCYQVTDLLPSGLAPVATPWTYWDEADAEIIRPYSVDGQRVSWCVDPRSLRRPLGYSARIVNPGAYRWEPAVIQSLQEPSIGSSTAPADYRIR